MLRTLLLPECPPVLETPHGVYSTEEDTAAATEMINEFQTS